MNKTISKSLLTYLQASNQEMQIIFAKIKLIEELQQRLVASLEPDIAKYCQVANLIDTKLVIIVANGSIATQLRFQTNVLKEKMNFGSSTFNIQTIECKVRPPQPLLPDRLNDKVNSKRKSLSPQAEEFLKDIIDSLSS